jgi:hypothetical protein
MMHRAAPGIRNTTPSMASQFARSTAGVDGFELRFQPRVHTHHNTVSST